MLAVYLGQLDKPEEQSRFARLYHRCRQAMYRAAAEILGEGGLAEDAVHNAFLWCLQHMDRVGEPDSPRAWGLAVTAAQHAAIDLYRSQQRELPVEEILLPAREEEDRDPLEGLPVLYAGLLRLRAYGFTPREIAGLQQKPVQTIYKQLSRGKQLLLHQLRKEGAHETGME